MPGLSAEDKLETVRGPTVTEPRIRMEMPAHSRHLHVAAFFIKSVAAMAGFDEEAVEAIEISVMEAVENVIDHASEGADTVCLVIWQEKDHFVIEVQDEGIPWPREVLNGQVGREMPPPEAPRGRGLAMMRALMDEVIPENRPEGGKTLRLIKHLTRVEAG
jgi:serine/threonine-protein kinase RsbW